MKKTQPLWKPPARWLLAKLGYSCFFVHCAGRHLATAGETLSAWGNAGVLKVIEIQYTTLRRDK